MEIAIDLLEARFWIINGMGPPPSRSLEGNWSALVQHRALAPSCCH